MPQLLNNYTCKIPINFKAIGAVPLTPSDLSVQISDATALSAGIVQEGQQLYCLITPIKNSAMGIEVTVLDSVGNFAAMTFDIVKSSGFTLDMATAIFALKT